MAAKRRSTCGLAKASSLISSRVYGRGGSVSIARSTDECPSNQNQLYKPITKSSPSIRRLSQRSKSRPPVEILRREWRAPITPAWTIVADFHWRGGTSILQTSLRLAAQGDHKFCAVACLRAQRFV